MTKVTWDLWNDIYNKIEERATTPCACDNCKGEKTYLNEEILRSFFIGLDISLELNSNITSKNESNMVRFATNIPSCFNGSHYFVDKYFNLECKNKGWFKCEKCDLCLGVKNLANTSALTNISEPFFCKGCIVSVTEEFEKYKKLGIVG